MTLTRKCFYFIGDDEKLADFLMDNFARVTDDNIKGETPLHFAAKLGKLTHISYMSELHVTYIIKLISD